MSNIRMLFSGLLFVYSLVLIFISIMAGVETAIAIAKTNTFWWLKLIGALSILFSLTASAWSSAKDIKFCVNCA